MPFADYSAIDVLESDMNAAVPAIASPVSSPAAGRAGPGGNLPPAADSGSPADFAALLSTQLLPPEEIAALAANALHPLEEDDEQLGDRLGNDTFSAALLGNAPDSALTLRQEAGLAFSLPASQLDSIRQPDDDALTGGPSLGAIAADDTNKQLKELASGLENLLGGKKDFAEQTAGESAMADKAAVHELAGLTSTPAAEAARKPDGPTGAATINTPLHSTQWSNDFSQKLVWMAKNDLQSAQLSINPSNLGPIEVTLSIGKDSASAHFASPFPEVRAALESALPRLKEMLAEAGVALSQADVGAQSQNRFGDGQAQRQPAQSPAAGARPTFPDAAAVIETQAPRISRGIGMVDTFA